MSTETFSKDYFIGAASVVGLLAVRYVVNLFMSPSLDGIAKTSSKPLPKMGDDDKLTVWGFEAAGEYVAASEGMPDASYFVSRVEAYLRAAKVPYVKLASQGGSENPRGKVPFANVKGAMTDESAKIISLAEKQYKVNLDKGLSEQQLATAHFIRETLHNSLYWVANHFWFHTRNGRATFRSELPLPPVIIDLVYAMVMRKMDANLYGHGMGRMPEADIIEKAKSDMKALSVTLGKQDFFLGTKAPTSIDCDTYAQLAVFFAHKFFSAIPWVVETRKEYPNLDSFFKRMRDLLYPEFKEKTA